MNAVEKITGTTITTPTDREIRIERVFNASVERVWQAFTDPKLVAQWWGRGNKLIIERMDVERGGHWRYVEHGPEGVHGFEGRYREVTPPSRIARTTRLRGSPTAPGPGGSWPTGCARCSPPRPWWPPSPGVGWRWLCRSWSGCSCRLPSSMHVSSRRPSLRS